MKKMLLLFIFLVGIFTELHASLRQTKYRWRNDDGNETTATWLAAENTAITVPNTSPAIRLRIEFDNDNGTADSTFLDETLQYSSDGGTTWTSIDNAPSDAFVYTTSTHVTNSQPTTNQMGSSTGGTFVAGRVVTSPAAPTTLNDGERTEYEWVIRPTANAVPGTTYIFQTLDQEEVPLTYPSLTISPICSGPPVTGIINAASYLLDCNTNTTLTLNGNSLATGISYQWQSNQSGVWTNFGTDNDTVTTPVLIQNTWFRCIASCNTGGSDTTDSAQVGVLPLPVHLGNDINACVDLGMSVTLDAGAQSGGSSYLWDDGSTAQTKPVNQNGTYSVKVTDQFGCIGKDTIDVTLRKNPVVQLGNDTSVCNGAKVMLDAGDDGISYFWSSGQSTQTITINTAGSYIAFVTNSLGCMRTDTINIAMSGELPSIQGISVTNDGQYTFVYTPVNPQHIIAYEWNFGDGSAVSNAQVPTHTFPNSGNYVVTLTMRSSCGISVDSSSASIVGLQQLNIDQEEVMIYPNPARTSAVIVNRGALKMNNIEVYNLVGQIVYAAAADRKDKHNLVLDHLAAGVYTVRIITDKGIVARKLQLTE